MRNSREKRVSWKFIASLGAILTAFALLYMAPTESPAAKAPLYTKASIAALLYPSLREGNFPESIQIPDKKQGIHAEVEYTLDEELQESMEKLLRSYRPDYGALVAMDATTGKILALNSYAREDHDFGNLALKGTFPAASIFKIITAAAAIDQSKANPDTVVTFNGGLHTLYRRNVNQTQQNKWTTHMSLREAFAKSVNVVFAKLGVFMLSTDELNRYAERFQFNQAIDADFPVESGKFEIANNDDWARAEVASGFNRGVTLSPLQGAMLAAAVANDGILMEPYVVEALTSADGNSVYQSSAKTAAVTIAPETSRKLRDMMRATVKQGTSRGQFKTLIRNKRYAEIEIGGKTGSLTGKNPTGKYDWFVGYAIGKKHKIAVAALTINEELWRVKSSYLARSFMEKYFSPKRKLEATPNVAY